MFSIPRNECLESKMEKKSMSLSRRQMLLGFGAVSVAALGVHFSRRAMSPLLSQDLRHFKSSPNARVVWHPSYGMPWYSKGEKAILETVVPLVWETCPVNILRYAALSDELLKKGVIKKEDVEMIRLIDPSILEEFHQKEYLERTRRLARNPVLGLMNGENPINGGLYTFYLAATEGTYIAARIALEQGNAINLSGGFHHAFRDHEEGFCFFNDVAGAIIRLRKKNLVEKVMIVDLDVHHGNGNAAYFQEDANTSIFDMYEGDIYPSKKIPVEHPIVLEAGEMDNGYLSKLESLSDVVSSFRPDLVFYLAGADPFEGDRLGGLLLTKQGLQTRDDFVLRLLHEKNIPVAVTLAGGYSPLEDLVAINRSTVESVLKL